MSRCPSVLRCATAVGKFAPAVTDALYGGLTNYLNFDMRYGSNALVRRQMDVRPDHQPRRKLQRLNPKASTTTRIRRLGSEVALMMVVGGATVLLKCLATSELISHYHVMFCGEPDDPASQFGHSRLHGIQQNHVGGGFFDCCPQLRMSCVTFEESFGFRK